jgi:transposase InsO family protein
MTGKADYTDQEWKLLREAPTSAGMLVIQADRGGTFKETFSMAKAYTEARRDHGATQLLDDIAAEKPEVDRTRFASVEDLRAGLLQHIRDAVSLLQEKATPEELAEYRRFLIDVANRVAEAHREGFLGMSGERVSDAERQALAEIAEAAGTSAPDAS